MDTETKRVVCCYLRGTRMFWRGTTKLFPKRDPWTTNPALATLFKGPRAWIRGLEAAMKSADRPIYFDPDWDKDFDNENFRRFRNQPGEWPKKRGRDFTAQFAALRDQIQRVALKHDKTNQKYLM